MADSLAEAAMNGFCVPGSRTELEVRMTRFRGVSVGAARTCAAVPPRSQEWKRQIRGTQGVVSDKRRAGDGIFEIATLNVLTLYPAEEREANCLRILARQARLASTFEEAGIEVIGLQECRLTSQLMFRECLVMVTSEAEDGRDGCGLWLSTRRVGREHITVVHSSSSVLMVAVRSKTPEANVVVAHSRVDGRERAEAWWEALGEMLSALANDVPMYVRIDENGRLGSSTSKHAGSLNADQETPNGERLRHFLVGANLCTVTTVICVGDGATLVPTRERPRRIDFCGCVPPGNVESQEMLGCE